MNWNFLCAMLHFEKSAFCHLRFLVFLWLFVVFKYKANIHWIQNLSYLRVWCLYLKHLESCLRFLTGFCCFQWKLDFVIWVANILLGCSLGVFFNFGYIFNRILNNSTRYEIHLCHHQNLCLWIFYLPDAKISNLPQSHRISTAVSANCAALVSSSFLLLRSNPEMAGSTWVSSSHLVEFRPSTGMYFFLLSTISFPLLFDCHSPIVFHYDFVIPNSFLLYFI